MPPTPANVRPPLPSHAARRLSPVVGFVRRAALVAAGTAGVRLDRGPRRASLQLALIASTGWLHLLLAERAGALAVLLAACAFYYGGNAWVLGGAVRRRWIRARGRERAYRTYESLLGLAFFHQGLGLTAFADAHRGTLELGALGGRLGLALGLAALVVGLGTKLWATWLVGLDVYYYRDLFLRRRIGGLVRTGPYRVLDNPMYGVGNLQLYAGPLFVASAQGLVAGALAHLAIWIFHVAIERPFVVGTLAGDRAPSLAGIETD